MLKLATILDNPGEPLADTRYRDPKALAELGYNAVVYYETTALSGLQGTESIDDPEMKHWVERHYLHVQNRIDDALAAGLKSYVTYDVLSLGVGVIEGRMSDIFCKGRRDVVCPGSDVSLALSVSGLAYLLHKLKGVSGVVLRLGDNDAGRLPHLVGNDLYAPHCGRCSQLGRVDRLAKALKAFHRLVVDELGLSLIARAWNVRPNGMHDSVELCRRLKDRLPGAEDDGRFILSFKYTHTDFWRYQMWNPSSQVFGKRPIIYELQCQREFEGKGGVPNYMAGIWRDGASEAIGSRAFAGAGDVSLAEGLAAMCDQVNLVGLWGWVRGGGWGGPFVENESWIDANVFAVPKLADHPELTADELAHMWVTQRLGLAGDRAIEVVKQVLLDSPVRILKGFYIGAYSCGRDVPWHPSADWIEDDLLDADAAWRIVQQLDWDVLPGVLREKQEAVDLVFADRIALQSVMDDRNRKVLEPLANTLVYMESFFAVLHDLLGGLIAYRGYLREKDVSLGEQCRRKLRYAQDHWHQHTQYHGGLPGTATPFREKNFWVLTQQMIDAVS